MTDRVGRVPDGTGLSQAEPSSTVSALTGFDPSRWTDSLMVPETFSGFLGQIARISSDYELREYVDGLAENPGDGLIWRDCMEVANAIANESLDKPRPFGSPALCGQLDHIAANLDGHGMVLSATAIRCAANEMQRLRSEHKRFYAALVTIANGDEPRSDGRTWRADGRASKHDQCGHGKFYYEDCGQCIAEYAASAIEARSDETHSGSAEGESATAATSGGDAQKP
jgi:hypothetical protein